MSGKRGKVVPDAETEKHLFEDEALESIWEIRERGNVTLEDLVGEVGGEDKIRAMQDDGLIMITGGEVALTEKGEGRARDVTRRHRLAERLFADVLDLKEYEEDACRLEHALSPSVEEAICTLLGHPPLCPHGKPIPKGNCCSMYARKVRPLVQSLKDLEVGKKAKVLFINVPAMDRLASIGLIPGVEIRLQQKMPSYVIEVDETTVAIDEDIARGVFVKQK